MHDRLAHCYFDTSHAIVAATASDDLPEFQCAVRRLPQMVDDDSCAAPPRPAPVGFVWVTTPPKPGTTHANWLVRDPRADKSIALIMLRSQVRFLLAPLQKSW